MKRRLVKLRGAEEEYKNSDKAFFTKEEGAPKEDVVVIDTFGKKQITFKWTRERSNESIRYDGAEKEGFSFYYARYVFSDPHLFKSDILATTEGTTGVIGRVNKNDKETLVINSVAESTNTIRIISAYYAVDPKYELFVDKYWEQVKRGSIKNKKSDAEKVYSIATGKMPESLKKRIEAYLKSRKELRSKF
jgi:uncharacterized DUF497 family protein